MPSYGAGDVLNYAPIGIMVLNRTLSIVECNTFAKDIMDLSAVDNGNAPPDMWNNRFLKVLSDMSKEIAVSGKAEPREIRVGKDFFMKDTRVLMNATSASDKEDTGFIVIIEDITMHKKTSSMLEGVLHNINILDQKIYKGMSDQVDLLQNSIANIKSNPEQSIKSAAKAVSYIRESIDFVKAYRRVGLLDPEWQDLSDVISRATGGFSKIPVEVSVNVDGLRILADAALHRVFSNLISNSLKHGKKVTKIKISYKISKGNLTLIYEDDGIGVNAEQKDRLFSGKITETERMGLFMISSVISASGLSIKEVGVPGEGAVFEIYVPPSNYAIY